MTQHRIAAGVRVLGCGGRGYADQAMLFGALDMEAEVNGVSAIIQGEADGADKLARLWAHSRGVPCEGYAADWRQHGRAAGPIRNQQMLDVAMPDKVFAFAGGRGTADMVRRAKLAGVSVAEFATPPVAAGRPS